MARSWARGADPSRNARGADGASRPLFVSAVIGLWPRPLTPLTARVLSGWGQLLAVGNLTILRDQRWSSWVMGVESIAAWHLLFLVRAPAVRQDFTAGSLVNGYTARARGILILMAGLYGTMELRRRSGRRGVSPAA